jgi:hypothetical protein
MEIERQTLLATSDWTRHDKMRLLGLQRIYSGVIGVAAILEIILSFYLYSRANDNASLNLGIASILELIFAVITLIWSIAETRRL